MKKYFVKGKLTEEDLQEINKLAPVMVEFASTVDQNKKLISEIDESCIIKMAVPEEVSDYQKEVKHFDKTFTPASFVCLLDEFEKIEKAINPNWSDLEKTVYIYGRLQDIINLGKKDTEYRSIYDLTGILEKYTDSVGLASLYHEFMRRQQIPSRYVINSDYQAWNEVQIGDRYYPVDLSLDIEEAKTSQDGKKEQNYNNFMMNKEFYDLPRHRPINAKEGEKYQTNSLDPNEVYPTIDKVVSEYRKTLETVNYRKFETLERPTLTLKSKELADAFENGEISKEILFQEIKTLSIHTDVANIQDLREDLISIGRYYPEVLSTVEISNNSDVPSTNMQELVDTLYRAQEESLEITRTPIEIIIASSNEEDFDIDFSRAPAVEPENDFVTDGEEKKYQKVTFRNTDPSKTINLKHFRDNMSPNIDEVEFDGINLSDVDVTYDRYDRSTRLRKITLRGGTTTNIASVTGLDTIPEIEINGISNAEFDQFMSSIYPTCTVAHDIIIHNQNLRDRAILQELSTNQIARLRITSSRMNNLDGLEQFDGRIAYLNLQSNDLGLPDLQRMQRFTTRNTDLEWYLKNNSGIRSTIASNSSRLSDESYRFLIDYYYKNGEIPSANTYSKTDVIDTLIWAMNDLPYYAKDAELIRGTIGITENPMMIENDSDIDTLDFNATYMQNGIMLLTPSQIEYLINSGKTIPQEVRVKISDVTELDSHTLNDLQTRMQSRGMTIAGVQLIYRDNSHTQLAPYTAAEYTYIRDKLDEVVSGINPSEPDLDKFATIYARLADSIIYDTPATKHNNHAESMYYAESLNRSRNLLFGFTEGKTVCAGYADILRNALALVGINARLNSGNVRTAGEDGHAWNQVELDDGTGNKKWYYTDLTWDRKKDDAANTRSGFEYMLRGSDFFIPHGHAITRTQDIEMVERDDYDRTLVEAAYRRAKARSFDFTSKTIDIPEDPTLDLTLDSQRIADEYTRRRNDMFAKFYGNKDYEREYQERMARFREHEKDETALGITYRTIENYPEKAEDEKFLFLDGYQAALERMTRFDAGDTSAYSGTTHTYDKDKEYIETRNHTFNQHEYTYKDLATMGKYGEKMPYIPKQQGLLKNAGRVVLNAGILMRNIVAPAYRFVGRYIAQPVHRLITGGKDASPYRNNAYHRMVARRDYFSDAARQRDEDETNRLRASASDPSKVKPVRHPIRNAMEARFKAFFRAAEGNEAVLRAGAADIKENIIEQEQDTVIRNALNTQINELITQISTLNTELTNNPTARNKAQVENALASKRAALANARSRLNTLVKNGPVVSEQTDAIDDKQHAVASKEVNTMRTTVIKGFAKGLAVKYIGPKIHNWILERTKIKESIEVPTTRTEKVQEWVDPTYRDEVVPIYDDAVNGAKSLREMMSGNANKQVTGFYSVYGGERRPATYTLTGDESITAIFQAQGRGGHGLSDLAGLKAPTLTDGTFARDIISANGVLNQDISLDTLINAVGNGSIDVNALEGLYVSVGDRYWTKLSDLIPAVTEQVKVDEVVNKVLVEAGHYEWVDKIIEGTETVERLVNNPNVERSTDMLGDILKGIIIADGVQDVAENLRKTTTDKKKNKKPNRKYEFDDEGTQDIPKSKREYDSSR